MMQCQQPECVLRLIWWQSTPAEMPRIIPQGCLCLARVQCTFYRLPQTSPAFCDWQTVKVWSKTSVAAPFPAFSCRNIASLSVCGAQIGAKMMPRRKRGGQGPLRPCHLCVPCSDSRLWSTARRNFVRDSQNTQTPSKQRVCSSSAIFMELFSWQ